METTEIPLDLRHQKYRQKGSSIIHRFESFSSLKIAVEEGGQVEDEMASCSCCCGGDPVIASSWVNRVRNTTMGFVRYGASGINYACNDRVRGVRASMVESSSDFVKRMEQAWLISQQPRPIVCSSCDSRGHIECKWCAGTGFFILGDNMLCQVPSRNTTCLICAGKGSMNCSDCKGTCLPCQVAGGASNPQVAALLLDQFLL